MYLNTPTVVNEMYSHTVKLYVPHSTCIVSQLVPRAFTESQLHKVPIFSTYWGLTMYADGRQSMIDYAYPIQMPLPALDIYKEW